ncbi:hypothetical protein BCR44DRAFT_1124819 [Catenaria anguillulae PL171]|uniref:Uncharacterized protein n=1 Tax=Catenaria anguillulae PL171 TaxID=765915 RepID=A0A1Y2HKX6_9FUNG|nr:hypothetical protein BCR44DRAFT_1124819 [Catenaria anguillulae PL171]
MNKTLPTTSPMSARRNALPPFPKGPTSAFTSQPFPLTFPAIPPAQTRQPAPLFRTGVDPRAAEFGMRMTSAGTWITAGDKNDQWALSHNGSMSGSGVVHSWMAKSTVFRGPNGMGELMAENLRGLVATLPVNLYSLGHCPKSTGRFTASKLSGEACKASIECVFSLCVNGKCAEAASGKQLDAATALQSMRRSIVEYEDKNKRENAEWWMAWIGTRIGWVVGGLVVLRVLVLANRRRYVARQQAKVRRAEATRRGADEPPEFVVGGPATSASDVQ